MLWLLCCGGWCCAVVDGVVLLVLCFFLLFRLLFVSCFILFAMCHALRLPLTAPTNDPSLVLISALVLQSTLHVMRLILLV